MLLKRFPSFLLYYYRVHIVLRLRDKLDEIIIHTDAPVTIVILKNIIISHKPKSEASDQNSVVYV